MLSCFDDLAADLFGSWPNATQGFVGSALGSGLGVFGAYLVAARQMRHERVGRRMAAGGEAAAMILEALLPVVEELSALTSLDPDWAYDQNGLSEWHQKRWRESVATFNVAITLRGHLLPAHVADNVEALASRLDEVMVWDVDDENHVVVWVDVAKGETLTAVSALADRTQANLTTYARSVMGDQR